jgi:hypothetical protein
MRRNFRLFLVASLALAACGGAGTVPPRSSGARLALGSNPEALELEPLAVRQQLLREISKDAEAEAGHLANSGTLFLIVEQGRVIAAPAFGRADLFQTSDAGSSMQLVLAGPTSPTGWSVDQRDAYFTLSEQEAANLVAASLLTRWGVAPNGPIQVLRVTGTSYAAAYIPGVLQLNASFVLLAAAGASTAL